MLIVMDNKGTTLTGGVGEFELKRGGVVHRPVGVSL